MRERLIRLVCFILGHNMYSIYTLNNAETFGGVPRSTWGMLKCMRCGKEEHWQWDHY